MNLSAPKVTTFAISAVLALVAIFVYLVTIPALTPYAFWLLLLAFVILAAGALLEGM